MPITIQTDVNDLFEMFAAMFGGKKAKESRQRKRTLGMLQQERQLYEQTGRYSPKLAGRLKWPSALGLFEQQNQPDQPAAPGMSSPESRIGNLISSGQKVGISPVSQRSFGEAFGRPPEVAAGPALGEGRMRTRQEVEKAFGLPEAEAGLVPAGAPIWGPLSPPTKPVSAAPEGPPVPSPEHYSRVAELIDEREQKIEAAYEEAETTPGGIPVDPVTAQHLGDAKAEEIRRSYDAKIDNEQIRAAKRGVDDYAEWLHGKLGPSADIDTARNRVKQGLDDGVIKPAKAIDALEDSLADLNVELPITPGEAEVGMANALMQGANAVFQAGPDALTGPFGDVLRQNYNRFARRSGLPPLTEEQFQDSVKAFSTAYENAEKRANQQDKRAQLSDFQAIQQSLYSPLSLSSAEGQAAVEAELRKLGFPIPPEMSAAVTKYRELLQKQEEENLPGLPKDIQEPLKEVYYNYQLLTAGGEEPQDLETLYQQGLTDMVEGKKTMTANQSLARAVSDLEIALNGLPENERVATINNALSMLDELNVAGAERVFGRDRLAAQDPAEAHRQLQQTMKEGQAKYGGEKNQCANITAYAEEKVSGKPMPVGGNGNPGRVEDRSIGMLGDPRYELLNDPDELREGDIVAYVYSPNYDERDHMGMVVRDDKTGTLMLQSNTRKDLAKFIAERLKLVPPSKGYVYHRIWPAIPRAGGSFLRTSSRGITRKNISGLFLFRHRPSRQSRQGSGQGRGQDKGQGKGKA